MDRHPSVETAIAAHRFGLGEASLDRVSDDPVGWLLGQIGPADGALGDGLLSTDAALEVIASERERRRVARARPATDTLTGSAANSTTTLQPTPEVAVPNGLNPYREIRAADLRSRLQTAVATTRPFAERLQWFWANHFTVSLAKGSTRGLVGAFEREAVRPHIAGDFLDLLFATTTHPAMLHYLDNQQSAGTDSRIATRAARRAAATGQTARVTGINENLAREVLELHTLGAESTRQSPPAYTQADVIAFANVLTGWRVPNARGSTRGSGVGVGVGAQGGGSQDRLSPDRSSPADPVLFDAAWHEPGPKHLLGNCYGEGPQALHAVLRDLAHHPATARFVSTKLAHHFVADDPPTALVDRLSIAYLRSGGQLATVYRALIESPEAWQAQRSKLKTPEEFVVSAMRVLQPDPKATDRDAMQAVAAVATLGQPLQAAPSPAGWSDRGDDWLGPDAVWKRVEFSTRFAARLGSRRDARAVAAQSFGPWLSAATRTQLDRAADGSQAIALLLMSPEFQRR